MGAGRIVAGRLLATAGVVVAGMALGGCAAPRETLLAGETMGSAWTVKIAGALPHPEARLREDIQAHFETVNQALSTWRADSALSTFNRNDSGDWVAVDPELAAVMAYGLGLAERSGGAYDLTVAPLVDLWGFGPAPRRDSAPPAAGIEAARARVGWRKLEVDVAGARARKQPGVRVDLSSLGKGRGVDRVAGYLDAAGVTNYLIDLSGKLRARGRNARGQPWRVAVEQPAADDPGGTPRVLPAVVALEDSSIATSGDYRRYFESGGRHFSHLIDPRTGMPVAHATISATAQAGTCMQADALATVFMLMAPEDALQLADEMQVPALLISREAEGYLLRRSPRWPDGSPSPL